MEIRQATPADRHALFEFAAFYARAYYPELRLDGERLSHALGALLADPRHFAWVAEVDGEVVAALLAVVQENLWAQRNNASVALWVSEKPGVGAKLLWRFRAWVEERRHLRFAAIMNDSGRIDRRAFQLAERVGFVKQGGAYIFYN